MAPDDAQLSGCLALPGRRVRDDESLDDTAHRALAELAGLHAPDAHLEQLRTYGDPARDPHGRVVSVAYLALTPCPGDPPPDRNASFVDVAWLADAHRHDPSPRQAPTDRHVAMDRHVLQGGRPLAYDHAHIVPDAVERARSKLEYTALATAFVSEPFTLGELRGVYEAVWGVELDAANFRRKVTGTRGFVVPTDERARPGPEGGRPATRYRRGPAARLHPAMLRPA